MESKVRIILGILLVCLTAYEVECASLTHHIRLTRDVELPPSLNTSVTDPSITNKDVVTTTILTTTQSSPTSTGDKPQHKISKENVTTAANKIDTKLDDLSENESIKSSVEDTLSAPKEKVNVSRGSVKFQQESKENKTKELVNKQEDLINKNDEPKATGRSLNIDIDKYVSPEFHNKNNVYSLPTSPEIEKFLEPDSEYFSNPATKSSVPKKIFTSRSTNNDYNFDLTTPQTNIFDSKFQLLVDGIKQNLDELSPTEYNEKQISDTTSKYEVSKLINNYKNADNDTSVSLETKEHTSIDLKTDKNKGNKEVESGKAIDYESTHFKSTTYGEENTDIPVINKIPDNEATDKSNDDKIKLVEKTLDTKESQLSVSTSKPTSTTFTPSKKPKYQVSLHNNTIDTTAPDNEVKSKSVKHFTYESSSLDPIYETESATYTKPLYENAINISKRGSTKYTNTPEVSNLSTTPSFMDFDNKNFTIPPTATAWSLISLKEIPPTNSTISEFNTTENSSEQNSQENNLVKIPFTPKETTTNIPSSTENDLISTTRFYKISSSNSRTFDSITSTNSDTTTYDEITSTTTEELTKATENNELNTTDSIKLSSQNDETTSENIENVTENTTLDSTNDISSTITENYSTTTEVDTTEISTTDINTTTEFDLTTEFTTELKSNYETTEIYNPLSSTDSISTTSKLIPSKTESENELYTTLKSVSDYNIDTSTNINNNISESTIQEKTTEHSTTKFQKISSTTSHLEPEEDNNSEEGDNDYSDIIKKEKNATDVNDPEMEIVPTDLGVRTTWKPKSTVSTEKINGTVTQSSIFKDQKSILENSNESENSTIDTTSSTDMLSHEDSTDDNNSGMIAAIAISSVGGVCLILLAGLLLIMRKRQKRVTYGQRCRPVSLDAYSLDNVSVYNSVRRKGALRASKRSYGNPAFEDPVSLSHQMNFQALVKFAENSEGISNEFDEIPQVTARANEVPAGCETKNRYANVIPLPETRVFLKASDNDPHSDYINANYVTGPKNTRGYYIACQAPMQNTVDDFWRMIWEQQCRVILMLTNLYENGIEKCADYLPPSEVLDCHRLFGDFQITLKKREVKEKYIISCLQLKNMVSNSWREVTHLWYLGWPERGVPTEANSLIAFLIEARSHLKTASNNNSSDDKTSESCNMYISNAAGSGNGPEGGPMVVHCSPGTGRTGTVIACDVAIRDFELTRAVDVPQIVYRVRRDRASAVQTRDQYAFIYKVISVYATKLTGGAMDSI